MAKQKKIKTKKGWIIGGILLIILIALFLILPLLNPKYTISFNGASIENIEVSKGRFIEKPSDPVKEGYKFLGWYVDGKEFDFKTPVEDDIKLEAKWIDANTKYLVTFNSDGGSNIEKQEIIIDELVAMPTTPTKKGYLFVEWQLDGVTYDFNTKVTKDIELKAIWEKETKTTITYTVTFDSNGGNKVVGQKIIENKVATKPSNPTRTGYTFVSWQLDGKTYNFDSKITKNITLKAKWEEKDKYTVTFDSNGGSKVSSKTVYEKYSVTKPTNPTKTGYIFVSWQLNGKTYNFATPVTKNITLKAVWKEKAKVTVTFDSDGGNSISSKTIYTGDAVGALTTPVKNGFTFKGWYNGTTKYSTTSKISTNITLKAKWEDKDITNMATAKNKITNVTITKGGQNLSKSSTGCTITYTPASSIAKIKRETTSTKVNITYNITCDNGVGEKQTSSKTVTGTISASPYRYTATPNDNLPYYTVQVYNGSSKQTGYSLSSTSGSYLASYSSEGFTSINNPNISGFPKLYLNFDDDRNTTYAVTKK